MGEILGRIMIFFTTGISMIIVSITETAANAFLTVMAIDIDNIAAGGFLSGFEKFSGGIILVSVTIGSLAVLWQLFSIFFGPTIGAKQTQSAGGVITRALIFIPLSYFIQNLALNLLGLFQSIYTQFYLVYQSDNGGYPTLSDKINPEFIKSIIPVIDPTSGELESLVSGLISSILIVLITWNFIKLLLEMTQRFVVMLVYVYLSPLAAACGVGANSINITKQALTLFVSSGVLWILNIWSVGVVLALFSQIESAIAGGVTTFFLWSVITYGFLKIAQQLDDIFSAVGATNVGFSGSILDDILSMSCTVKALSGDKNKRNGGGGLDGFAEKGLFAVKGSNSENPIKPEMSKIPLPSNAKGSSSENKNQSTQTRKDGPSMPIQKTTTQGKSPSSLAQAAKAFIGGTAVGKIARGVAKTGENIGAQINNGASTISTARDNGAMNTVHGALSKSTPEGRADAMKNIAQNNPSTLNNDAAKEFIGDNLGLKENQSVTGLSVDKEGKLSATISTQNEDGSVGLSKVENINETPFSSSRETGFDATPKTATYTADQFANEGEKTATIGYAGMDGNSHSAEISKGARLTTDGGNMADFSVTHSEGQNPINVRAPASMSAADVGSIISGTADDAIIQKFTAGGGDASAAMSALNVDQSVTGSVSGGSARKSDASTYNDNHATGGIKRGSSDAEVLFTAKQKNTSVTVDHTEQNSKNLKNVLEKVKKAEHGTLSSEDAPVGKHL